MSTAKHKQGVRRGFIAMLAGLSLLSGGCAVLVVGAVAGAVLYADGELTGQTNGDMYQTVDATKRMAAKFGMKTVKEMGDENWAKMVAHDRDDNRIAVQLTPATGKTTKVKIRVNNFGDEDYSRRILSQIQRNM